MRRRKGMNPLRAPEEDDRQIAVVGSGAMVPLFINPATQVADRRRRLSPSITRYPPMRSTTAPIVEIVPSTGTPGV